MKFLGMCLIILSITLGAAQSSFSGEAKGVTSKHGTRGGDMPFPLGAKTSIPWSLLDGYWTDYKGNEYYYRIEILETYKDGSRTVSVALMDEFGLTIVGTGLGFVRANSQDLWAQVKSSNLHISFRLQAFNGKNLADLNKTALVVSLKDKLAAKSNPLVVHALTKVDSLENRIVTLPEDYKTRK